MSVPMKPCADCGRLIYHMLTRCGDCANTPRNLTAAGLRRLREEAKG